MMGRIGGEWGWTGEGVKVSWVWMGRVMRRWIYEIMVWFEKVANYY
jgi:hypothetical protein